VGRMKKQLVVGKLKGLGRVEGLGKTLRRR
jgi:hypothetical protein